MAQIGRKHSVIKPRMDTFHAVKPKKQSITGKMFGSKTKTHIDKRHAERKTATNSVVKFIKKAQDVAAKPEVKKTRHWIGNRLRDWGRGAIS